MFYDDHSYCLKCDKHERTCWCYGDWGSPEEEGDDLSRICSCKTSKG